VVRVIDVNGRTAKDGKTLWLNANCVDQEARAWFGAPPEEEDN
jgi:hypothetical protein